MQIAEEHDNTSLTLLDRVLRALADEDLDSIRHYFELQHASDIASVLDAIPDGPRLQVWELIEPELRSDVLTYLNSEPLQTIVLSMESAEAAGLANTMQIDDLIDVVESLPDEIGNELFKELDVGIQEQLVNSLSYEEGTAGRLMADDFVAIRQDVIIDVVLRYLRIRRKLPEHTDQLLIVDEIGHYRGTLSLEDILTAQPDVQVSDLVSEETDRIPVTMSNRDVADIFEKHDLVSAPVIDDNGQLLGRITIDDVIDIIRAQADAQLLNMSGLVEDSDLFAPVMKSTRGRAIWLGINLLTAFLASWVIGLFQDTLDKVVSLAILMPIVASMGGIAGSQTLTLTIRGIALNQIVSSNLFWLTRKEFYIGLINGLVWSVVVGLIAWLWLGSLSIGIIIAAAVVINLIAAALAGIMIPMILERLGQDPALSGSVILTTVTDVVGFMSFLGLATLFLI